MYVSTIGPVSESVNYSKLNEKTSLSAGRLETFRALGVARGQSRYKLKNKLAFYSSIIAPLSLR